jgi:hypothetical protein
MTTTLFSRGQPYPLQMPSEDSAVADFLRSGGNRLLIRVSDMNSREENAFRSGLITGGFLYKEGDLLWLFRFYDNKGLPIFTFDAPFDARLIPSDDRQLHNIDNAEQRLVIDIHAVDDKGILRAIRAVTLPPALTLAFLSAVQDQLSVTTGGHQMALWFNKQPEDLAKTIKMETLGR